MRKLLLLLAMTLTVSVASAQIKVSLKGGMNANVSNISFDDTSELENLKSPVGFNVGLGLKLKIIPLFYLQADAMYSSNVAKYGLSAIGEGAQFEIRQHTLDVPVLLGLQPLPFLRLYAGPRFSFNLGNGDIKSINTALTADFKETEKAFGYQVGVGLDIAKIVSIDLSYNGLFNIPSGSITVDGNTYHNKINGKQVWLTIGYYIL